MKKIQIGGHKTNSKIRGYALVDDEDYEFLSKWNWYPNIRKYEGRSNLFYAYRREKESNWNQNILMHREIMRPPKGMFIDHIDGNGLNNQKSNLRIVTNRQNCINTQLYKNNTSGFKGVSWRKKEKCFTVQICLGGKRLSETGFKDVKDAAIRYNELAKKHHGEFARLNIII